jgi:cytochrome c oxidase assembly protein subunit 11
MTTMQDPALRRRNARVLGGSLAVVAGMVAVSFAAVPLYDLFCRVTGFGGTTQVAADAPAAGPGGVLDREIDIRFLADTSRNLPWAFQAEENGATVRIGEASMAYFSAENTADLPVAGTAVYNVTPARAGLYFYKVQCFCFEEQIIQPGETVSFPVWYYVDPAIADDPQLEGLGQISLSYTFYPTASEDLDRAIRDYQRGIEDAVAGETAMLDAGGTVD